ncbi:hypothetical protein [Pseudoxanthomonas mexicana]|uniref:hypothetical protein n=1 Tax=Pseudoxanthomonas mexicana TaxID=128785 RepID=UPI000785BDA1|nr:hypothetical protein [Pseudoxanthomonas mexicana]
MKPKPSASVLRVLAALGLSLALLAACKKREPVELAGAASEPAAAVRQLATHLQRNDLVGFARDAVPPDVHARLDIAWRAGQSRWPLTELPLEDKLVPMLAALSAKDAERTLGLFGVQYVKNEGDYTQEERDHYAQVIAALGDWAQQAPLGDPALAKATLARLAPAARRSGLSTEQALNDAGMTASLQRLTPFFIEAKATFTRYGLPLDATFADLRTGLVEQKGDIATVRIHYPLGEREIDTVVSLTRRDGQWYLTDYLRHAEDVLAGAAPALTPPASPVTAPGNGTAPSPAPPDR